MQTPEPEASKETQDQAIFRQATLAFTKQYLGVLDPQQSSSSLDFGFERPRRLVFLT